MQKIPSVDITAAASPDGDKEFLQRKLPYKRVAVTAEEIEHSIPSVLKILFIMTWAFKLLDHLKNLIALAS